MRKLISKCDDIIELAENPIMGGLGNSTSAFKLYEATIIEVPAGTFAQPRLVFVKIKPVWQLLF